MSWRIYPELGIERWLVAEEPSDELVDAVLWRWLPALEAHGPLAMEAEVGVVLYAEAEGFLALQLPDRIAENHVAEGFVEPDEEIFVIVHFSSAHP